jgi:hypothetical protein
MRSRLLTGLLTVAVLAATAAYSAPPPWRGQSPGTAYLGDDVLWRTRETLVFHLLDDNGRGFNLDLTLRDMNLYQQGPRPVLVWLVGPSGKTLVRQIVPDDGIVSGNAQFCDGISDVYADYRYREWHRHYSPGGTPPGKQRSPLLSNPETLPARPVRVVAPADGKGLYRLVIVAGWDYWVSVTPSRPLMTGVHSGPGPLYVHGNRLQEAWLYAPPGVQDLGLMLTEEVAPYNWQMSLEDEQGKVLGRSRPRTFASYILHHDAQPGLYRLQVRGQQPGACLHIGGIPALICPDAQTARRLQGGVQVDAAGRLTHHPWQRQLLAWADKLTPADLQVPPVTEAPEAFAGVPEVLAAQDLDPRSPTYGKLQPREGQRLDLDLLSRAAATPGNPYYRHAALVRRVLLARIPELINQGAYYWFETEMPRRYDDKDAERLFALPLRSNWYCMMSGQHAHSLALLREIAPRVLPPDVMAAWQRPYVTWVTAHNVMHQGECTNQWCAALGHIAGAYEAVPDPLIKDVLNFQIERVTTPGNLGRVNPDSNPAALNSVVRYSYDGDAGTTGAGYPADGMGHDNEYCLESEIYLGQIWQMDRDPRIRTWFENYYFLKTHLTLLREGALNPGFHTFSGTVSPTDSNHRTCCYTHKTPMPAELRPLVRYGLLWDAKPEAGVTWPCLETEPFVRNVDNEYIFVNTPGYYAILYAGSSGTDYMTFGVARVENGSAELCGYGGMHYGGYQYKATKPGGLSAVYVRGFGPTLLSQNLDVMYSNVVWGRSHEPLMPRWVEGEVDPRIICSGYGHPFVTFDPQGRVYRKVEEVPHAPLTVTRTMKLRDDRLEVEVELLATADLNLAELYEAIPLMLENRQLQLMGERLDAFTAYTPPETLFSRQSVKDDYPIYWEKRFQPASVKFRAVDLANAAGAGSAIVFDREYTFRPSHPLKYRDIAAPVGSFSLVLKPQMRAGERQTVRYVITPHQQPLTPAQLQQYAP